MKTLEKYNLELIHLKKMGFFLEKGKYSIQYSDVKLAQIRVWCKFSLTDVQYIWNFDFSITKALKDGKYSLCNPPPPPPPPPTPTPPTHFSVTRFSEKLQLHIIFFLCYGGNLKKKEHHLQICSLKYRLTNSVLCPLCSLFR